MKNKNLKSLTKEEEIMDLKDQQLLEILVQQAVTTTKKDLLIGKKVIHNLLDL